MPEEQERFIGKDDKPQHIPTLHPSELYLFSQRPTSVTTLSAMAMLEPTKQLLIADIALALATADTGQQRLANALRKLIEGRP